MATSSSTSAPAAETIRSLQYDLARQKWAFLPAAVTRRLLADYSENGRPIDESTEQSLHALWDSAVPQQDEHGEAVYPYKGSLVSYYRMDTAQGREFNVCRSSSHDLAGSEVQATSSGEEPPRCVEYIDPTTVSAESKLRSHKQWPTTADSHPCIQGLQRVVFQILSGPSDIRWEPAPGTIVEGGTYEPMMTAYRVTKKSKSSASAAAETGSPAARSPSESESGKTYGDADPGPEGIHQDLAELTVIVLLHRRNLTPESAGNRVWTLDQPCGKPSEEDVKSARMLKELVLRERFDALFVLDREAKHEVLGIGIGEEGDVAVRDVLTFEVRRPRKDA